MADATVLGMALETEENDPIRTAQPLSAVIVAKLLGDDGEIYYVGAATEGLKSVETLGMLRYAQVKLEHRMMQYEDKDDSQ